MRSGSFFAVIVGASGGVVGSSGEVVGSSGGVVGVTLPNIPSWSYQKSKKILVY
jgi:hypothetical protein